MRFENLHLFSVENSILTFGVTSVISNYDPDKVMTSLNTPRSYFYHTYRIRDKFSEDDIKKLFTELFERESLKLHVNATFKVNLPENGIDPVASNINWSSSVRDFSISNPHITYQKCLGDNLTEMLKAMSAMEYDTFFAYCISATSNVNFAEAVTATYLVDDVLNSKRDGVKPIELPDGTMVNAVEAMNWLDGMPLDADRDPASEKPASEPEEAQPLF